MSARHGWWLIRIASLLVPNRRRNEWLEEWRGEFWAAHHQMHPRINTAVFALGAVPHAVAEFRAAWSLELLWLETRLAARALRRAPVFLVVSVLLLAVGIGANTTIFSLVNAVLLREPAGVHAPGDLVQIGRGSNPNDFDTYSHPVWLELRRANDVFADVAAYGTRTIFLEAGGESRRVESELITSNYFDVLGVSPTIGRAIQPHEEETGRVAILSFALWQQQFGGTHSVLGSSIILQGAPFTVIGVAPKNFRGGHVAGDAPDVWLPIGAEGTVLGGMGRLHEPRASWLWLVARLKKGVSFSAANDRLQGLHERLEQSRSFPTGTGITMVKGLGLRPAERDVAVSMSALLQSAVGLVLLIACLNLASLVIARGARRGTEVSVRLALGATRAHLTRQLWLETMMLAALGAFVAFGLTFYTAQWLEHIVPWELAVTFEPDGSVFAFALLAAVLAATACGLWPAWRTSSHTLSAALRAGAANVTAGGTRGPSMMVGLQIALSFVLLLATALLTETLVRVSRVDPGFRTRGLTIIATVQPPTVTDNDQLVETARRIEARLAGIPGVQSVALASSVPLTAAPSRSIWAGETVDAQLSVPYAIVSASYFATMEVAIERGRAFDAAIDRVGSEPVIIVSRSLAARLWPGEDAVGKTVTGGSIDGERQWRVIGIAEDVRMRSLREPPGQFFYLPVSQQGTRQLNVYIGHGDLGRVGGRSITTAIREAAPPTLIAGLRPIETLLRSALGETRLLAGLVSILGAIALLMATVGLFGVVSQTAAVRQREFGLRLALGAAPHRLAWLIIRHAGALVLTGLAIGIPAGLLAAWLLRDRLFDVSTVEPHVMAACVLLLSLTALAAVLQPVVRAIRTDPVRSLNLD